MIASLDHYCREHPDEEIEVARRQLVMALGRRVKEEQPSWSKDMK
jgi:hypothetical protein